MHTGGAFGWHRRTLSGSSHKPTLFVEVTIVLPPSRRLTPIPSYKIIFILKMYHTG